MSTRWLHKKVVVGDVFVGQPGNSEPAILLEGGIVKPIGSVLITDLLVSGQARAADGFRFGTSPAISAMWGFVATMDFGSINPMGTAGAAVASDVAASGAAITDYVSVSACGSVITGLFVSASVFSAGAVQLKACHVNSGAYNPGSVPYRILLTRFA